MPGVDLTQEADGFKDSGVIDPKVDGTQLLRCPLGKALHCISVGNIELRDERVGRSGKRRFGSGTERETYSQLMETAGNAGTHTAARSSDHSGFVCNERRVELHRDTLRAWVAYPHHVRDRSDSDDRQAPGKAM